MAELTSAQEASVQAGVQEAYAQWLPLVQRATLASYNRFGLPPDPSAAYATAGDWNAQVQQLEAQQLQPVAQEQYDEEDPDGDFGMGDALMVAAAAATLAFLASQVGEVINYLYGLISGAKSQEDAVAQIKAYLDPSAPHWRAKSAQLAVSEGNRWAQAASLTAAVAVEKRTRTAAVKIWVTRDDNRVRAAHASTDGQRRALLTPFNVAGFPMMHPMDPAAPPSLVVNCRCWMRFEHGRA